MEKGCPRGTGHSANSAPATVANGSEHVCNSTLSLVLAGAMALTHIVPYQYIPHSYPKRPNTTSQKTLPLQHTTKRPQQVVLFPHVGITVGANCCLHITSTVPRVGRNNCAILVDSVPRNYHGLLPMPTFVCPNHKLLPIYCQLRLFGGQS